MSIRIENLLAQMIVSDLDRSEGWYTTVLEAEPDNRPMPGLIEWQLSPHAGVQLFEDGERAGQSAMVIAAEDLDALAKRLASSGIAHPDPKAVNVGRVLPLTDPDGNQVVFSGA